MENTLEKMVREEIARDGRMTFSRFMDMALYTEGLGFYQTGNPFGTSGSFYTSVNTSASFGRGVARSIVTCVEELHLVPNVCEMGAGSGMLANDVLTYLHENEPDFYHAMTYTIIERSDLLREKQRVLLAPHGERVRWVTFEEFSGFKGVFFSNELVDAFSVHRLINIEGEIKEMYVIEHEGELTFFPDDLSTPALEEYLERQKVRLIQRQIGDINLNGTEWIRALGNKLEEAVVITIDYGYTADQLFTPMRMDGTATCYYNHHQNNDFFERIGKQDITAFVDFSSLMNYGKEAGLEKISYEPQWMFLIKSGLLDDIQNAENDLKRASMKSLIMPEGGFGTTFQVLMQGKNVLIPEDFHYLRDAQSLFTEMAAKLVK